MRRSAFAVLVAVGLLAGVSACGKERVSTDATPREREVRGASAGRIGAAGKDRSTPASGESFTVRMSRTSCYGLCPEYDVELDADGSVRFNGAHFVRVRGKQAANVPASDVVALLGRFDSARFFDLTWKDPCDAVRTDSATVTLTLVRDGRKRTTVDYLGNGCIPASLRALEEEVDRVARTATWTKCAVQPGPMGDVDWCER
jgi:hypothetical protein